LPARAGAGASEDHAILQCNLFLGLGLDAYIAVGRLPGGVLQHVWVVTREPNGNVLFWETTKGDYYILPARWTGLYLDGAADSINGQISADGRAAALVAKSKPKQKARLQTDEAVDLQDRRKLRAAAALAQDKAEREAQKKAKEVAEAHRREEMLLFLAQEEQWTAQAQANPFETPRDVPAVAFGLSVPFDAALDDDVHIVLPPSSPAMESLRHDAEAIGSMSKVECPARSLAPRRGMVCGVLPISPVASARLREQVAGAIHSAVGQGLISNGHDKGGIGCAGAADPSYDCAGAADPSYNRKATRALLPELDLPPMKEQLPYETLEILVNHENVWANLQGSSIVGCSFNMQDDKDRWHPFIHRDVWMPPAPPRPFYSVGRIGPQLPPARLSALRLQLFRAIKNAYAPHLRECWEDMEVEGEVQSRTDVAPTAA
jgi:hypothetical protein